MKIRSFMTIIFNFFTIDGNFNNLDFSKKNYDQVDQIFLIRILSFKINPNYSRHQAYKTSTSGFISKNFA